MKNPIESDLRQSIPHLAFEFYHFRLFSPRGDGAFALGYRCSQAIGYAFLVHLRILVDFFYTKPENSKPDDLLAADFRKVFGRFELPEPPTDWNLKDMRNAVNKRLAHLTAQRWGQEERPTMDFYEKCVPTLTRLIEEFQDALPVNLQAELDTATRWWSDKTGPDRRT